MVIVKNSEKTIRNGKPLKKAHKYHTQFLKYRMTNQKYENSAKIRKQRVKTLTKLIIN